MVAYIGLLTGLYVRLEFQCVYFVWAPMTVYVKATLCYAFRVEVRMVHGMLCYCIGMITHEV